MKRTLWITCLLLCAFVAQAAPRPAFEPQVDALMDSAIVAGGIPGGVICLTADTGIVFLKAYGNKQLLSTAFSEADSAYHTHPDTVPMTTETVFDLASLTKSVATTTAIMTLVADSALDLNTPVRTFLPRFHGDSITLMHLLTHTSGLPSYLNANRLAAALGAGNREALIDTICTCMRRFPAGTDMTYSCLNFITLQRVVEEITHQRFDRYCQQHVFEPMGMKHTSFYATTDSLTAHIAACAPTEVLPDSILLCGFVHDPLARVMNCGISGNAGCFSTAQDLARLAQFLLINQDNPLVQQFTTVPDSLSYSYRTPGWAIPKEGMTYLGTHPAAGIYGHTGYTGTSIAISPAQHCALIILTNRAHPYDQGAVAGLRQRITDVILSTPPAETSPVLHQCAKDISEKQ